MIEIQPVGFPLNLGVANSIDISINSKAGVTGAIISYRLFDTSISPIKSLTNGYFDISEEDFVNNGNNKQWAIEYISNKLGITLK